jgi:serine/threonine-protein kinase
MSRGTRYRVIRKLAHGGMAEIFLALQIGAEGFEKPVVLKRILPGLAADPGFVRMLVDEAHIASSLSHSHLVQVLDLGKAQDQFFLVLEFVDGFSLEQVRRRARKARLKMPLPLQLYIVSALCRGLDYVHRRTRNGKALGIVHRDVTPQNVLVSREGEVKLADFGIAKAIGRREKSATGVIKGKFAYMSPEQTIGAELDARSDLFSVGTLLYLLTTGQKPFDASTDLDVLMQVRRARYEKPSTLVRDFNPEVERFIARALRADRSKRWQSAEQMADRLDAILVKLGQPTGPAALKRWLDTLTARDGVLAPGDVREVPAGAEAGTIALLSADLELQNLTPPDEPLDDDEPEEPSTARASVRARTRVAADGTRKQAAPLNEAMTVVANAASVPRESVGTAVTVIVGSARDSLTELDRELDELLDDEAASHTTLFDREERSRVPALSQRQDEGSDQGAMEEAAPRTPRGFWNESPATEPDAEHPRPAQLLSAWFDEALPDEVAGDGPREPDATELAALAAGDDTPPLLLVQPTPSRPRRNAGWGRALRRLTLFSVLLAGLTGVGAYLAQPYLPPGLTPSDWVSTVDGWLERAQRTFEALRSAPSEL